MAASTRGVGVGTKKVTTKTADAATTGTAKKETTTSTTKGTKTTTGATKKSTKGTSAKAPAAAGAGGTAGTPAGDLAAALTVATDRTLIRAHHHSRRYAVVELTAPAATTEVVRPAVNVAFVLDRSGSMGGGRKFPIATAAIRDGIARLTRDDRFSIVAFDSVVDVIAPSAKATAAAKAAALRALEQIGPRGGTNLADGWLRGAEQVAAGLDPDEVNRILVLTDGHANAGETDTATLADRAAGLRVRGIATSTFGVGDDHDERLLGAMADSGGGAFRYIAEPAQIAVAIAQEVGELLEVTARGAEVRLTAPAGVHIETLSPFPLARHGAVTTIAIGDMVSDQIVRIVAMIDFPMGTIGSEVAVAVDAADRSGTMANGTTLTWTFADNRANDRQARDRSVDRIVARIYADRALRDVVDVNRQGRWEDAVAMLTGVADRIASYAGDDPELQAIVSELRAQTSYWAVERMERDRKVRYARSVDSLKSRLADEQSTVWRRER